MNTAYPLLSISILVILLYSLSFAFSRIGMISKANHRKFWNMMLLLAFLTTGLIGLFMVIKINYKFQLPFYEQLVGFHVSFGIGMVLIGFFHLWWHLGYYLKLFRQEKNVKQQEVIWEGTILDEQFLKLSALLLGCTSIIAQVVLMREFLSVFSGNELVIGLVLANWMVLTGLGAYLGKFPLRIKKAWPIVVSGLLLMSVLPFVTAFLINFLKNIVFPVGSMINVFQIFGSSFLLLIPFCLVSGFLFTFIANFFSEVRNRNETGAVYGLESAGSVIGGLLSGLLFIFVFSSIESLLVLAIFNSLVLFLAGLKFSGREMRWIPLLVAVPAFILLFFHPEKLIRSLVYPNQEVVVSKDSPHGNIVITRHEKMWSVYSNNTLLFDSENFLLNEEAVHFTMLQRPDARWVLLVSGGLAGQLGELQKYKPTLVDYVEDNRWLLALMKDSLAKMTGATIHVRATDPLRFIRNTTQTYDVAILNLQNPSTMQANRFFTLEFYQLLKQKLSTGGVLSFAVQSPPNYLNQEAVDLNSSIFASLKKVFQQVIVLQGEKLYFLASDSALTYHIARAVQQKGIENKYVNPDYFNDVLLQQRGEAILSALNPSAEINQNLNPVSYNQQLAYWMSQFSGRYRVLTVVAASMALFVFFRGSSPSKAIFLTGFSASGLEILLLFGLQVFFGNVYLLTSFVFTGFMLGLAAGSFLGKSFSGKNYTPFTQLLIGVFALIIGLSLFSSEMAEIASGVVYALYLAATILIGALTGFQFTQVSQNRTGNYAGISGKTYSYDLVGSALGALAVSIYLVPRLGIVVSVLIIGLLNLLFGVWLLLKTKARF
jgi:spermidine synthase